jgi:hypothetical protein
MAGTKKLSVEKALNKLREADARQSKSTRRDEEIDALDNSIKRSSARERSGCVSSNSREKAPKPPNPSDGSWMYPGWRTGTSLVACSAFPVNASGPACGER